MPIPRKVLNAFPARDVSKITGLSLPMIDYLLREDLLRPSYGEEIGRRGKVRYYSYRDLVVARLIQRLREAGLQLGKLKVAVKTLCRDAPWVDRGDPSERLNWLIADGNEVFLRNDDGFLDTMTGTGQRAFAFVINLNQLEVEVRDLIPAAQRAHFDIANRSLMFADASRSAASFG
ncbi:MAG: MerR family transcriptional regulator [Sphingopyxis sp.]|nr:MerR family transcriptional regulator [Sphingopyxis sp.]